MKRFLVFAISALSLGGVSAAIFYILFKKDEEDIDPPVFITKHTVVKVKIPKDYAGVFVGRVGANIQRIENETKARLKMNEVGDERFCTIHGTPAAVQHAETLIHEFIEGQPKIETHEFYVPQKYVGYIIGRGGERIRLMKKTTNAKIQFEDDRQNDRVLTSIKGTREQINLAVALITTAMEESDAIGRERNAALRNRSPRAKPKNESNNGPRPQSPQGNSQNNDLCPPGNDQSWEVFVSALISPSRFWVQVINEKAKKLDDLTNEMTEYYSNKANQELHTISKLTEGKIVASPFPNDDKYYRARVLSVLPSGENQKEKKVNVFFVDFGDSAEMDESQVLELRTDFLTLRFQAIQCYLAHVAPGNSRWSKEAIDLFDDLAETAMWVGKRAVFKTYPDWNKNCNRDVETSAYAVELFAKKDDELVNIGEELIKRGFAVRTDDLAKPLEDDEDEDEDEDEAELDGAHSEEPSTAAPSYRAVPELSDSDSDIDGFYID